jgi:predicted 3-demethylubiquinone-9 3-methyltransferase (glyoxalase superfamily)
MQSIHPFLWFDSQAEEAANFYVALFPNSRVTDIVRCGPAGPGPEGSVLTVSFELNGQSFVALNGGPMYRFNEAVSFVIPCETQEEVDRYWDALMEGGQSQACGWLKDRYGLSWQVTPTALIKLLSDPDQAKAGRVMRAMQQMIKLDIPALEAAAAAV